MSSITINDLVYDAKSGDQLDNVSLELKSPQVVAATIQAQQLH